MLTKPCLYCSCSRGKIGRGCDGPEFGTNRGMLVFTQQRMTGLVLENDSMRGRKRGREGMKQGVRDGWMEGRKGGVVKG
jgi:hypothetical protein